MGAGPIGLATLLTAQFFSPVKIIMIDLDENRLEVARHFGATDTINSGKEDAAARVMALTGGVGVDAVVEAVGVPATFELCEDIVAPGGTIANVGVHGRKVDLHLERLWSHNIAITTRLVDTDHDRHASAGRRREKDRSGAADHPPLHPGPDSGCL